MFLVKRIIVIMCAKNYKSKFKFVKVIQKSVDFFPDMVYTVVIVPVPDLRLCYQKSFKLSSCLSDDHIIFSLLMWISFTLTFLNLIVSLISLFLPCFTNRCLLLVYSRNHKNDKNAL